MLLGRKKWSPELLIVQLLNESRPLEVIWRVEGEPEMLHCKASGGELTSLMFCQKAQVHTRCLVAWVNRLNENLTS